MIKKILLILFIFSFLTNCGKKGDPVFNQKSSELLKTRIIMIA